MIISQISILSQFQFSTITLDIYHHTNNAYRLVTLYSYCRSCTIYTRYTLDIYRKKSKDEDQDMDIDDGNKEDEEAQGSRMCVNGWQWTRKPII
jgi:hypothetical protein